MTISALPLRDDSRVFAFQTDLSGVDFRFVFYWNASAGAWYFDLDDADGVRLRSGVKVVLGTLLLRRSDIALPAGNLYAVDLTGSNVEAGETDLGTRVKIFYDG